MDGALVHYDTYDDAAEISKPVDMRHIRGTRSKGEITMDEADEAYSHRGLLPIVLEQVNFIRQALAIGEGKLPKLPRAVPGDSNQCVLARALSNGWVSVVDGTSITLRHPNDGTVDFKAAAATLRQMGFQRLRIRAGKSNKIGSISFRCTAAMEVLIDRFDSYQYKSLVR